MAIYELRTCHSTQKCGQNAFLVRTMISIFLFLVVLTFRFEFFSDSPGMAFLRTVSDNSLDLIELSTLHKVSSRNRSSNARPRTLPVFQTPHTLRKGEPQARLFSARGLSNPGKVRRRVFEPVNCLNGLLRLCNLHTFKVLVL